MLQWPREGGRHNHVTNHNLPARIWILELLVTKVSILGHLCDIIICTMLQPPHDLAAVLEAPMRQVEPVEVPVARLEIW